MKNTFLSFGVALGLLVTACNAPREADKKIGIDLSLMDKEVRPQDDFYNYVNGAWMKSTEIPDDKTRWGSFNELRDNTDADVMVILKAATKNPDLEAGSDEAKAVQLFEIINDTLTRNQQGIQPLVPHLERIGQIESITDVQAYLEETLPKGNNALFGFYVSADAKDSNKNVGQLYPGALGIERDYYLKEDEDSKKIKAQYETHVGRMFGFIGKTEEEAKTLAAQVVAVETSIAAARMDKVERRDPAKRYNPKNMEEMQSLATIVDWVKYFSGIGAERLENVIVTDLGYFSNLDGLMTDHSIDEIKAYLWWTIIDGSASQLTTEIDLANWEFYSKTLKGAVAQEPLEKRALRTVNWTLGEALGKLYVGEKFPPEAKAQMKELVGNLIKAYTARINNLGWMAKQK